MIYIYGCVGTIVLYNNAREPRSKLTRSAVLPPRLAPWRRFLKCGDNGSFVNITGFTKEAFQHLVRAVLPDDDSGVSTRGRPSLLSPEDKLGVYLIYVNSLMEINNLCLILGIIPSTCSIIIDDI